MSLIAGDETSGEPRHERQMADEHGVRGPTRDHAGHRLDGIVGAEAGRRLHDIVGCAGHGQQLGRLLRAQLAAVDSPRRAARRRSRAGERLPRPAAAPPRSADAADRPALGRHRRAGRDRAAWIALPVDDSSHPGDATRSAATSVGCRGADCGAHRRGRSPAVSDKTSSRAGEVLRLRNLVMIENIRRAEDPAWRDRLERQQVLARLGRRSAAAPTRSRRCPTTPTACSTSCGQRLFPCARLATVARRTAERRALRPRLTLAEPAAPGPSARAPRSPRRRGSRRAT